MTFSSAKAETQDLRSGENHNAGWKNQNDDRETSQFAIHNYGESSNKISDVKTKNQPIKTNASEINNEAKPINSPQRWERKQKSFRLNI